MTITQMFSYIENACKTLFQNEIMSNITLVIDRRIRIFAECQRIDKNNIKISINSKLLEINPNIVKNTLLHELIHAWQFDNGYTNEGNGMHGKTFNMWCNYIYQKIRNKDTATIHRI